jgi:acyl dehydratase
MTSITDAPPQEEITDEMFEAARSRVGMLLRPEGPYLTDATSDTLRNFCNGIGDLNPLYREPGYGAASRYSSQIGHPMFPYAFGWTGRTRWGFTGVHGFYAGNDWEFFKAVRPGDRLSCIERVVGVEERDGNFSGRMAVQYTEANYLNQRDELVARVLGWCTRHARKAARDKGKYKDVTMTEYTGEQMDAITEMVLTEPDRVRGQNTRYFEDVVVGQELEPIARGPLSLMDTMGFLVGCGRGHTHGVLLQGVVKHPGHYFANPESGGGIEYTGIGHHRESVAKSVGAPGTYDYGPQRTAWMCSAVTNWMGDHAVLKRVRADMRRFNTFGDVQYCKGKVTKKYQLDGVNLVDLEIWAENQRGELTAPGLATVALTSRDPQSPVLRDGSQIDLKLPTIR